MGVAAYANAKVKRAMLASATRVHSRNKQQARSARPWQVRAYEFYSEIGEVRNAARYFGNSFSKLGLVAQEFDSTIGESGDWRETDNAEAKAELQRWAGDGGSHSPLLSNYGVQQFLGGRSYLTVTVEPPDDDDGDPGAECWEMLSPLELRVKDGGYTRIKTGSGQGAAGGAGEELKDPAAGAVLMPGEAIVYDLWLGDPAFSDDADAPLRSCLDICEELILLTRRVRSEVVSRLASSGILFVPDSISFPADVQCPDDDPDCDPLLNMLVEAGTKAIEDEGSAAAFLPIIARLPDTMIEKVKLVNFNESRSAGYPEVSLRSEAIERLAHSLDLPIEIMLGLGSMNHWGAWAVTEDAWKAYLQPTAERMVNDLTGIVYRPNLMAGGMDAETAAGYRIWYDESKLVSRPDKSKDATLAFDRGALGWEGYRQLLAIPEGLAPTGDEQAKIAEWIAASKGRLQGDVPPGDTQPETQDSQAPVPSGNGSALAARDQATERELMLAAMAELAVERCMELAGSRLRTKARGTQWEALMDGVANADVPDRLPAQALAQLGFRGPTGALKLVNGGAACLAPVLARWDVDPDDRTTILMEVEQRAAQRVSGAA